MIASIGGKVVCDCKRCAELPTPKELSKRQWQRHRKKDGVSHSVSSHGPRAANAGSNASQQEALNPDLWAQDNGHFPGFDDEPGGELTEENLSQNDEETFANEREDESQEEDLDDSEEELRTESSPVMSDSEETDERESDEDEVEPGLGFIQDRPRREESELDEDDDMEIRALMAFSGTSTLVALC